MTPGGHASKIAAGAMALAAIASAALPAAATASGAADFALGLTTRSPASPTGNAVHVFLRRADDPNAKPPALRSAMIHLPDGLRFDTTAVPQCTASDAEIQLLGTNACPSDSELTVGSFSAITGFGPPIDPLKGDDHVFNGRNEFIEIITAPGTPISPVVDHLTISGSTLTAHPPAAPGGPPDGQGAVRSLDFKVPARTAGSKSLITTPPECPTSKLWTTTATFGFADGSTSTVASTTQCERATGQPQPVPHTERQAGPRSPEHARRRAGHRRRVRAARPR
ncbi:MAG: hypothetical protein ACJ77M_18850 [Thermoleophilaceae bacterium]